MKKVGILTPNFYGGAEKLEVRLAIELSKLGYQVTLLPQYSENKLTHINFDKKVFTKHNISIFRLCSDKKISLIFNLFTARKFKFDFLISPNIATHILSSFISMFTSSIDIKALHGYFYPSHTKSIIGKIWKWSIFSADFTYHVSNFCHKINVATFALSLKKSCVIKNAIDPHKTNKNINLKDLGLPENKKIILTVGNLSKAKGYENNLRIAQPILLNTDDTIYVIAGGRGLNSKIGLGYKDVFKNISLLVKELKIENKVYFIGHNNNIPELMKESKVYLHFANRESFGLVLLEAIREGLPVVTSNIGGIPEVLNGTEYSCFDLKDLKKATTEVYKYLDTNKDDLKDYSEYFSKFTHEKRALSVSSLLKKIVKKKDIH